MVNQLWRTGIVVVLLTNLGACAAPEPLLRSNKHLQLAGKAGAQQDIEACEAKAERAGLRSGVNRTGSAAQGGVLGMIIGAGSGASAGLIGGGGGVVIGAVVGGGLGLITGVAAGAYGPTEPNPAYADAVARCLTEKGYEVGGWQ